MSDAPDAGPGAQADYAGEARALFSALQDWARRTMPVGTPGHDAGAPSCQWCPLCRFVGALHGERPDLADLAERARAAGTALAAAVQAVLDTVATPPGPPRPRPRPQPAPDGQPEAPPDGQPEAQPDGQPQGRPGEEG